MGLDDFKTEESQSSSNTQNGGGGNDDSGSTTQTQNNPYKRVGVGTKQKVFQTEEQWERTVEYVENGLGFDIDEVMGWPNKIRHRALHVAIINSKSDGESEEFDIFRQCFVCGKTYNFPHDWDFMQYNGSAVCGSHEFSEVKNAYSRNNGEYQEE